MQLIFWDVMAQDWSAKETADSICNKILRRVFPGAVICLMMEEEKMVHREEQLKH